MWNWCFLSFCSHRNQDRKNKVNNQDSGHLVKILVELWIDQKQTETFGFPYFVKIHHVFIWKRIWLKGIYNVQGKIVENPVEEMKWMGVYIQFLKIIAEGLYKIKLNQVDWQQGKNDIK